MRRTMTTLFVVLALAGCTKEQATDELGSVKKAERAAAAASAHANVAIAEPLGVDECDSYLQKYESCLTDKVPVEEQESYRVKLDFQRRDWEKMAADPAARDTLVQQCKDAATLAKDTFGKYGCDF